MRESKIVLEFVCSANFERSPIAAVVGTAYIASNGLANKIAVMSSGAQAVTINHLDVDIARYKKMLLVGKDLGAFDQEEYPHINRMLEAPPDTILDNAAKLLYARAQIRMRSVGGTCRGYALAEAGLPYTDESMQQTVARPDTDIVLAMDEKNAKLAARIYQAAGYNPLITTLPAFTGTFREVPEPFGRSMEAYRELVAYCQIFVPIAVAKSMEHHT